MRDHLFFINPQSYVCYNKQLAKGIGHVETIILQHLIDMQNHVKEFYHSEKHGDFFFPIRLEEIEDDTGIHRNEIEHAMQRLQFLGFIQRQLLDIPAHPHVKIFQKNIIEIFNFLTQPTDAKSFRFDLQNKLNDSKSLGVKGLRGTKHREKVRATKTYKSKREKFNSEKLNSILPENDFKGKELTVSDQKKK